ncbi:hypothetical protein [Clostridium tertium]|uniref:Uncharacterized protein n=1 Tax=Clostridium tertium TaxID=1559 RepID=A0A6N2YAB1_9CLOT
MLNLNLIDLYNGFVKNYENLSLNRSSQYEEITTKENKFFITLCKFLGYNINYKRGETEDKRVIINFKYDYKECKYNKDIDFIRETDMANDLFAVQKLSSELRFNNNAIICILETFSDNRIDYLNNIILSSPNSIKNDLLLVYVIRDILSGVNYHHCYLLNESGISKSFVVKIKGNRNNILSASYMDEWRLN